MVMKRIFGFLALLVLTCVLGFSAYAEENKVEKIAPTPNLAKEETPITKLDAATDLMMKDLDENQIRQFAVIQNAFGIIRAVEDVQQSVSRAVESCGKANPDTQSVMGDHFEAWKNAVRPVMKEARTRLDKMILLQSFTQPSEVRAYLKKFEAAVVFRNQGIKSIPISKKEDCEILQKNMDTTQDELIQRLTKALNLDKEIMVKSE